MKSIGFSLLSIAAFAILNCGLTTGQEPSNPGPIKFVNPDSGNNVPGPFRLGEINQERMRPNHPPLDEIPEMALPSPADGISNPNGNTSSTFHDAETSETYEIPLSTDLTGDATGQSTLGDYHGAFNEFIPESAIEGFGGMTVANSLDSWPRSGNVKLVMRFVDTTGADRWFVCSGSMQDSGVVLCAAHCVYARTATGPDIFDWAEEVYVYPAWDGVGPQFSAPGSDELIQNFGWARGTAFIAGSDWINNGNFDRDVGLIRISRGSSRNIGLLTGWFGWAWGGCDMSLEYHNFSYPAEGCGGGLHTGRTMYYWNGTWDDCPGNQFELTTGGNCLDTVWGGMSGSGAYFIDNDNRFINAVCSNSNRDDIGRYAKLWEQFVTDMENFEDTTRGADLDLELLRCRAQGSTTVQAGTSMDDIMQVYVANATNNNPPSDGYTLRVYLSSNNNISEFDTLLATWNYTSDFAANSGRVYNIPAPNIPDTVPAGTYWIGAILDTGTDAVTSNNDTDVWDAQMVEVTPAAATVGPSSYDVFRGIEIAGNLNRFDESDNFRSVYEPGFTLSSNEAPVWLVFDGNAPIAEEFLIESHAGTPGLTYTVEFWAYDLNIWEPWLVQEEVFGTDQVVAVNLNSFNISSTGEVQSRVGWRRTGFTLNFPWQVRVDQVGWRNN